METDSETEWRSKIFNLVDQYLDSRSKEKFVPGESWIKYAGRVFNNDEILTLVDAALDGWITAGKYTEEFEYSLSQFLGVYSSLVVNSGSSANLIAVSSLTSPSLGKERLRKGDEVVTIAAGFPTTVNPIVQNGLVPVFVDIEGGTYNINPDLVEDALSAKTKAIVVAHTLGNPFNIDRIEKIAKDNNLFLIEDNCDALGSEYRGKKTGTFGDLSTLSFYPAHHITMGEGGAVMTNNPRLERIARSFRDWGRDCYCETGASDSCGMRFMQQFGTLPLGYDHKYVYSHIGYNLKATDLQAAIGVAQLRKLSSFIERRKSNFAFLYSRIKEHEDIFILPKKTDYADPSWFAFPITVRENAGFSRNDITGFLESSKIMTRTLFAGNLVRHPAYTEIKKRIVSNLEVTDQTMISSFFIGVYPGLKEEHLSYVGDVVDKFARRFS